jgi:hypothetical protein
MIKPIPGLISLAFTVITSDQTKLLDSAATGLPGRSRHKRKTPRPLGIAAVNKQPLNQ